MNGLIKKTVIVAVFLLSGPLFSHDGYWAPADPPKSGYRIDASIDMKTGKIEGKETISMKNDTGRPIDIIAINWRISKTYTINIKTGSKELKLINETKNGHAVSPLFYRLPKPLKPGARLHLKIKFTQSFEINDDHIEFGSTNWYPRLWWNGLPAHDAFSVKLDIPDGYALAVSGRLNKETGRHEIPGAKTFGIYLGRDQKAITREVEGVKVTTLSTEKGAPCAAACMETALDAIAYYKEWLGLYPFDFLYIIPGGSGRWGGYPFATGIVVIHGQETFKPDEKTIHWKRITAHEIGHEYWGEWVLDPDDPAWVWIGMGIFADTEYMLTRGFDPKRRQGWMSNYLKGLNMFYDTTVDIPPDIEETIQYDRNNTVIHSKGYSIVSALDVVLGRKTFERVYKKILREYGGKRLGWKDLQQVFEADSGSDLSCSLTSGFVQTLISVIRWSPGRANRLRAIIFHRSKSSNWEP